MRAVTRVSTLAASGHHMHAVEVLLTIFFASEILFLHTAAVEAAITDPNAQYCALSHTVIGMFSISPRTQRVSSNFLAVSSTAMTSTMQTPYQRRRSTMAYDLYSTAFINP